MKTFILLMLATCIGCCCYSPVKAITVLPTHQTFVVDSSQQSIDPSIINNALDAFRHLSRKEKRNRITQAKVALQQFRQQLKRHESDTDTNTILLCILAILLPPLAVYLKNGEIDSTFWISLLLTLLFWIPGVIFALLVVLDVV